MKRRIEAPACVALLLLCLGQPRPALAARNTPPHPSGIVIHLFGTGATATPSGTTNAMASGITITSPKGTTPVSVPVSLGFAKALAKMLNDSGTPVGLSGRQANLPPQSIAPNQRHPAP
jgi:hypothetical protein